MVPLQLGGGASSFATVTSRAVSCLTEVGCQASLGWCSCAEGTGWRSGAACPTHTRMYPRWGSILPG
eukprot:10445413-Alexandrium_andersonii.AAC.1